MSNIVPYAEIQQMAQALGKTKMFGKTVEELIPLMLIAQAEGLHPAIAAQEYDIIQGRPALNSRSALARFQKAGGKIQWHERADTVCSATFSHAQGGEVKISWTIDRARNAKLTTKDNWVKFPAQMLSARVVAEGVRACYPACLSGMYTVEEVQDQDTPIVLTKEIVNGEIVEAVFDTANLDESVVMQFESATTMEELQTLWHSLDVNSRHAFQHLKASAKSRIGGA